MDWRELRYVHGNRGRSSFRPPTVVFALIIMAPGFSPAGDTPIPEEHLGIAFINLDPH